MTALTAKNKNLSCESFKFVGGKMGWFKLNRTLTLMAFETRSASTVQNDRRFPCQGELAAKTATPATAGVGGRLFYSLNRNNTTTQA